MLPDRSVLIGPNSRTRTRMRTAQLQLVFSLLQYLFFVVCDFQTGPAVAGGAGHRCQADRVFHQEFFLVFTTIDEGCEALPPKKQLRCRDLPKPVPPT